VSLKTNIKVKYEPLIPDNYFHIYNCGNNKENIFKEDRNYDYFLKLLKKHVHQKCDVLVYCLLKNHFHLVIRTKDYSSKEISQSFSNFFNSYSKSINKFYGRTGSLFKDRFSRIKINNESYLKNLIIYVHLNPKHHGLTDDFKNYKYSSYLTMLSNKPTNLDRDYVLNLFEDKENFQFAHEIKNLKIEEELLLE